MIFRETYLEKIRPFYNIDVIKVLTGIRRSGKSVMLEMIQEELKKTLGLDERQIIAYNFENRALSPLQDPDVFYKKVVEKTQEVGKKVYLFFDEIQLVRQWESCINSFRVALDCDIYLTGSNSSLLSGELATLLSGRYVSFVIYPFSFAEYLQVRKTKDKELSERDAFQDYLTVGGMPFLEKIDFAKDASLYFLQDMVETVLKKDIIARYNIRDVALLDSLYQYVFNNIGTTFSALSIAKYLKSTGRDVSVDTILNYLSFAENAFLFYKIQRSDVAGKRIFASSPKYYVADHGIRVAFAYGVSQDISLILENIVCMEMLRRGYKVTVGKLGEKAIDFICMRSDKKLYIQVCYLLASKETIDREFSPLESIHDNWPKYVLSLDDFDMGRNGIIHKNLRSFLLDKDIFA
jgi:predicted AAA+ superfamily ATPase